MRTGSTTGFGGPLRLDDVTIRPAGDRQPLLEGLSLCIAPGEVVTIMGASGSGKSTLVAFVGGFLDRRAFAASGRLFLGEDRLDDKPAATRRLGVLFQDPVLFPHLSVGGNLLFGLPRASHRRPRERRAIVDDALARLGLPGFASRDPATLSGGQKARVALLRTLLSEPRALLLDEPFGKLDASLRGEVRDLTFSQARERGLPTLLVTHDPDDAEAAGGPVYAIEDRVLRPLRAMTGTG
jgi:putative thiamine transport system ATP-binding protein